MGLQPMLGARTRGYAGHLKSGSRYAYNHFAFVFANRFNYVTWTELCCEHNTFHFKAVNSLG